jgi:FKBP-type peptidyl-prolyl cis-trans isomerase 2
MPLVMEVKDGEVVSMEYQNGKEIDPTLLELFQRYNTLEKLFAGLENRFLVEGTDQGPAEKVTVTYDETYGFPKEITIDFIEKAIDDELYLTVSEFEVLP